MPFIHVGDYKFIDARHYGKRLPDNQFYQIVLHSTESPVEEDDAENVAHYFGSTDREASAHFIVGSTEIVQCVELPWEAYGVPGWNLHSIHIEHVGYAAQSEKQWLAHDIIPRSVELCAKLCTIFYIRPIHIMGDQITSLETGILRHMDATLAIPVPGGHMDPGTNFPLATYISALQVAVKKNDAQLSKPEN